MPNQIQIQISEKTSFAEGHAFGETGPYELLRGRTCYAVDPLAPAQANITDLGKAPRNADGLVEFAADTLILTPTNSSNGNRRLFFDWGNRGNLRALQFFNDAPGTNDPRSLDHAGNGFLMQRGYTFVWAAWQGDLLPGNGRAMLDVPIATDNGKPLTGLVRSEFVADEKGINTLPLSGRASTHSYPTVSLDPRDAKLTKRRYPHAPRIPVHPEEWCFACVEGDRGESGEGQSSEVGLVPSPIYIHLYNGFQTGWIYELVYTGYDPLVLGLGHIAVRDLISFLKFDKKDSADVANPVGKIEKAYGYGRSQTGRTIRDFIYEGFNQDEQGRKLFDGVMTHVPGAGLMWMNHRFANVTTPGGQQYEYAFHHPDRFPFSYAETTDHLTGKTDAILKRPESDPHVIHTHTSTEYWQRHGSLVHTDTQGNDLIQPNNVRIYAWVGSQHFASPLLAKPSRPEPCQNLINVVDTSFFFRALLDALDSWVTDGTPPPDSRHPTREQNTLIPYKEWKEMFPAIPGRLIPKEPARLPLIDFGPESNDGIFTKEPPDVVDAKGYPIFVPACDIDGNDLGGLRAPMVEAPLGTYVGWNTRIQGYGHGATYLYTGSYIPFPDTADEREWTDDKRAAILERYKTSEDYVAAIMAASRKLAEEGFILKEDLGRIEQKAKNWYGSRHATSL